MYPSIFQSILQSNPLSPPNHSHSSIPKKRIPPFHPNIDDQTGPGQTSKKLKTFKQPSELFADIADNLFSYYSDLGNMKKTCFPFQLQFPQILEDNHDLLSQTQTQSQSSSSNFEQTSAFSLLFSSNNSSQQNSAQKSIRPPGHNYHMIKEEEAETASKGRSFISSGVLSARTPPKKRSKEIFKITRQDKNGFVLERKLEFDVKSKNESPLKKTSKALPEPEVSQKQDELKNRLEDILKQAQNLLDNMKETATQITHEPPKKENIHVKHEIVSQDTQISEREMKMKIEPKIEEDQTTYQIVPPQLIYGESANNEEMKRTPEIRVGEAYQVDINNICKKNKGQNEVKLVWDPEKFHEEELAEYYKKIKKIIKMDPICEEKALKVLSIMEGNVENALKEIKENSKYYMSHLKVNMRTLRSQNPTCLGLLSQNNF